ncbi:MAG: hypothetical protein JWN86_139 [Planctomycetota bacterium]|nr:hypothetical protein [Planctomycetota bacterium]
MGKPDVGEGEIGEDETDPVSVRQAGELCPTRRCGM